MSNDKPKMDIQAGALYKALLKTAADSGMKDQLVEVAKKIVDDAADVVKDAAKDVIDQAKTTGIRLRPAPTPEEQAQAEQDAHDLNLVESDQGNVVLSDPSPVDEASEYPELAVPVSHKRIYLVTKMHGVPPVQIECNHHYAGPGGHEFIAYDDENISRLVMHINYDLVAQVQEIIISADAEPTASAE
ncbi:hypothetical protein E3_1650 [Rhodococcus phage E3]|uniref:hypothetical protein n=1 Tax=Rhodococcus phage E3 TaxID=1007869 RepID=UPI0002C6A456|nr:hypothetical protein M176_gp174 [Rhodococcus phage E3]AEQ21082.1 hypothetical protein E3_1650 [Rhodococcus phage E3]